jgi:hypothetical protein
MHSSKLSLDELLEARLFCVSFCGHVLFSITLFCSSCIL